MAEPSEGIDMPDRTCTLSGCARVFTPATSRQIYCSRSCQARFNRDRDDKPRCSRAGCPRVIRAKSLCGSHYNSAFGKKTTYTITCVQCGDRHETRRRDGQFCSDDCKGSYYAASRATRCQLPADHPVMLLTQAERVHDRVEREAKASVLRVYFKPCVVCSELFTSRYWGVVTCGDACAEEKRLASASRARHRRRERVRADSSAGENLHWRRLVREDGAACHLCGYDVNPSDFKTIIGSDGRPTVVIGLEFPTIDHVEALAAGGSHTRSNVRLAHAYCNSVKSDRPLAEVA